MAATKSRVVAPVRVFDSEGREMLPHKIVREMLDIGNRGTYKQNLIALQIDQSKSLSWEDVKRLLALKLFLTDNIGGNSIQMFCYLESEGQLEPYFEGREIDLNNRFKRLKDKHEAKYPRTGISRHTVEVSVNPSKPQNRVVAMV